MNVKLKKLLSVCLAAVLLLSAAPLSALELHLPAFGALFRSAKELAPKASAADYLTSGYCGDTVNGDGTNIAWSIDENGVLTLTGTGVMGSTPNREDNRVTKLIVGEGITCLADYAFAYCQNLVEIVLPSTLETTGGSTFSNNTSLISIDFGGTREIGGNAFRECTGLLSVDIPGTVEEIGPQAFYLASNLHEVLFHEGLKKISHQAFWHCYYELSIANDCEPIVLPDSLEEIGYEAFRYCRYLRSVDLGNGVKSIENNAFSDSTALSGEIVFPDSCEFVGGAAFKNTAVTAFVIGSGMKDFRSSSNMDSLVSIDVSADNTVYASYDGVLFTKGYTQLVQVPAKEVLNIPAEFPFQDYNFLIGWTAVSYVNIDEDNQAYCSIDGIVYLKDRSILVGCPQALHGSVTIANGTREIGGNAFRECTGLLSVDIPGTVEEIGPQAFYLASNLHEVLFHEGLKKISHQAFWHCYYELSIANDCEPIVLPDSLEEIGYEAFRYCRYLRSVDLGNGVKSIGNYAFDKCVFLSTIRLSNSLESWDLGNSSYSNISSLTVPNRYTELKNYGNVTVPASGGVIRGYCGSSAHEMAVKRLYTFESLGHSWLDWYTVTPATFEHDGIERRDCAYCDGYEERVTPKLQQDTYTATFVADGRVVSSVDFQKGTTTIEEPAVPARDRYTGRWEDYTLNDADITINAVYTLIQSGDVSEIETESSVTHYIEKDNVLFRLKAYSDAKTVKSIVSQSIPLDIVLVVDQSGSMDEPLGGSVKKVDALKDAAAAFIERVAENAAVTGADHRIAIAGFGLAGSYSGYLYNENTELLTSPRGILPYADITPADYAGALVSVGSKQRLLDAVASIEARGATAADLGLEMAKGVFANTDSTGRERVVVFMTDGEPTYTSGFQTSVANAAVYNANLLKNAYDALIYSVGVFGSAEANNAKIRAFMKPRCRSFMLMKTGRSEKCGLVWGKRSFSCRQGCCSWHPGFPA